MTATSPSAANEPGHSPAKLGVPGTLLFENDRIRIWELVLKPGEVSQWHDHTDDHLLVVSSGAQIANLADGSKPDTAKSFAINDDVVFVVPASPGVAEWPINMSPDRTLREIIIDLKNPPGATVEPQKFAVVPLYDPATVSTTWTPTAAEFGHS